MVRTHGTQATLTAMTVALERGVSSRAVRPQSKIARLRHEPACSVGTAGCSEAGGVNTVVRVPCARDASFHPPFSHCKTASTTTLTDQRNRAVCCKEEAEELTPHRDQSLSGMPPEPLNAPATSRGGGGGALARFPQNQAPKSLQEMTASAHKYGAVLAHSALRGGGGRHLVTGLWDAVAHCGGTISGGGRGQSHTMW